jgi:hypothetical protein
MFPEWAGHPARRDESRRNPKLTFIGVLLAMRTAAVPWAAPTRGLVNSQAATNRESVLVSGKKNN